MDILTTCSNLSKTYLEILNAMFFYVNLHGNAVNPSHATIAEKAGLSVATVKRAIAILVKNKLIKIKGEHRHSSVYFINPLFFNKKLTWALRSLIPNLLWTWTKGAIKARVEQAKKLLGGLFYTKLFTLFQANELPIKDKPLYIKYSTKVTYTSAEKRRWYMANVYAKNIAIKKELRSNIEDVQKTAQFIQQMHEKRMQVLKENPEEKEFKLLQNAINNPGNIFAKMLLQQFNTGVA